MFLIFLKISIQKILKRGEILWVHDIRENICIDYLSATFSYIDADAKDDPSSPKSYSLFNERVLQIIELCGFKPDTAFKEKNTFYGYKDRYTFGEHIFIQLGGPVNAEGFNTVQLLLQGRGCRKFEEMNGDWHVLLKQLHEYRSSIKELHFAFDLFHNDYFSLDDLLAKVLSRQWTSFSQTIETQIREHRDGTVLKKSFYIGSIQSETCINFYDKKAQKTQEAKKEGKSYLDYAWVDTWFRIELRMKGERAKKVASLLLIQGMDDFAHFASGVLKKSLEFKTASGVEKMRDRNPWGKWKKFLRNAESVDITKQYDIETTLSKKEKWIGRSAANSLKLMWLKRLAITDSPESGENLFIKDIRRMINDKDEILTQKELDMLNDSLEKEYGMKRMKKQEVLEMLKNI